MLKLIIFLIIIMTTGKITTNAIFYNRGVPNSFKIFGKLTTLNYSMLRQIARFNVKQGRHIYSFF
jgi:hypothetical protein